MAAKQFGQLVNDCIDESKVTLDHLTPANFASPPRTVLYNRLKSWVNMAYKELFIERNEWFFRTERANFEITPRVHLSSMTYTPQVGDQLVGVDSGTAFTVLSVHTFEDVEGDANPEFTLGVSFLNDRNISHLFMNEVIDRVLPTAASAVGKVKGIGNYNFRDLNATLSKASFNDFTLFEHPSNVTNTDGNVNRPWPLTYIPWDMWAHGNEFYVPTANRPEYVTHTPDGNFEFYPIPDRKYVIQLDYSRKVPELVNFTDVPEGIPEEYHDFLMWRAVQELADFDGNAKLFLRASKHVEKYTMWMHRDLIQPPSFGRSKFSVTYYG